MTNQHQTIPERAPANNAPPRDAFGLSLDPIGLMDGVEVVLEQIESLSLMIAQNIEEKDTVATTEEKNTATTLGAIFTLAVECDRRMDLLHKAYQAERKQITTTGVPS